MEKLRHHSNVDPQQRLYYEHATQIWLYYSLFSSNYDKLLQGCKYITLGFNYKYNTSKVYLTLGSFSYNK